MYLRHKRFFHIKYRERIVELVSFQGLNTSAKIFILIQ